MEQELWRPKRRIIDNSIEEKILTGMVVSDKFLGDVASIYRDEFITVSYIKTVSRWCLDYYKKYKQAPGESIQDIFSVEKNTLEKSESKIVEEFLENLSERYQKDDRFNAPLFIDQTMEYFRKRSLELSTERINSFLEQGSVDRAEQEISRYRKFAKSISAWINPFELSVAEKIFDAKERDENILFTPPGHLGDLIGPFERGTFVGVLGAYKRYKSWWLVEFAFQALLARCKVAYVSLEMDQDHVADRIYKRLTAFGNTGGEIVYPCFDCRKNQVGNCKMKQRTNQIPLIDKDGNRGKFNPHLLYRPCIYCREHGYRPYEVATWFTVYRRPPLTFPNAKKQLKAFHNLYGRGFRLRSYPSYSANVSQVLQAIDELEEMEGFVPDVVIIDYADILAPEDKNLSPRDRIDETWKKMKYVADVKRSLVMTVSQSNRKGSEKITLVQTDVAEDIRKIAHVNMMLAINQTPQEKRMGIVRFAKIAAREGDFDQYRHCLVLQQIHVGQPRLDSEIIRMAEDVLFSGTENPYMDM